MVNLVGVISAITSDEQFALFRATLGLAHLRLFRHPATPASTNIMCFHRPIILNELLGVNKWLRLAIILILNHRRESTW